VPALAAAAVLAGGTAVWAARRRDERHRASLTYTAAPVLEPTGAVVTRTLALSGSQGDHLRVVLHVRNPTADRIETVYEPDLTTGRRTTTAPYPVTPYHVRLAAHDSTTVSYSARLGAGDVDMSRLAQLEAQLDASNTTNRLAVAHAGPEVVHLRPQQRAFLNLSGVLARSSTSDLHKLLSSIAWHSSAARVANVEQPDARAVTPDWRPVVVASHPGRATLRAEVGDQSLDVDIVVAGARVAAPSTPCEPGVGDPPGLSTLPDGSSIASPGGGDGHVFVMAGGARLTVDNTSAAALVGVGRDTQTVSDADLAAISTIPRDRTLLQPIDRPGDEWVVVGGAVAPIAATDVQPLGLGTPVRVLQKWLGALPVYAPATFAPRDGTLVTDFDRATTVVRLDGTWHATTDVCPAARVVRLPHSATAVAP
jgi:hypothetical protein